MVERRPTRSSSRLNSEPPNPNPLEGFSPQSKQRENIDAEQIASTAHFTRGSDNRRGPNSGGRVVRRQALKKIAPRLSSVTENSIDQNIDPQLKQLTIESHTVTHGVEDDVANSDAGEAFRQQRREVSSASAVTAQTRFSQQELSSLDQDVMVDALPDLHRAAHNVIKLINPGDVGNQVQRLSDRSSVEHKILCRRGKVHSARTEWFGTEEYINPSTAIRGIFEVQGDDNLDDPMLSGSLNIFYLSNVATLFVATFILERDVLIEKLESDFASLFFNEVDFPRQAEYELNGYYEPREKTFTLALDIRCHYCVWVLKRYFNDNTDEIIRQCFFTVLEEQEDRLKGWDTKGLRTEELSVNEQNQIRNRIKTIRGILGQMTQLGKMGTLKALEGKIKWTDLQASIVQWIMYRSDEIENGVDALGGVEKIRMDIEHAIAQRPLEHGSGRHESEEKDRRLSDLNYSPSVISHPPTDIIEPQSTARKNAKLHVNPDALRMLGLGENRQTAEETAGAALRVQQAWQPNDIADEQTARQTRNPLSELPSSHEIGLIEQNKENIPESGQPGLAPRARLIDHQDGAMRVSFDTQESAQPGTSTHQRTFRYPDQMADHPGSENVPEPSQDEGFQTDTRPDFQRAPVASMRRNGEDTVPTRPRKRARKSNSIPGARVTTPTARSTPQEQPAAAMDLVPGTQADLYARVNTQSRLRASQIVKPRKAKEPWTPDEINALVDYIAEWGFLCGKIKEVDMAGSKRLVRRDNVALKDKARNMKMDYLRGQIALPLNFDEVPLNKALDQRLRDANIEPPPVVKRGGDVDT